MVAINRPHGRDFVLLLVLGAIWGASYLFIKLALVTIPPLTIAAGRVMLAAVLLNMIARRRGHGFPRGWKTWSLLAAISMTGNVVPFFLIGWGETRIDSSLAAILLACVPLSTVVLAHFMTADEKLSWTKAIGVGVGLIGILVLIGGIGPGQWTGDPLAQAAVLLAAVFYAISGLMARRLPVMPALVSSMAVLTCSSIATLPLAMIFDQPWTLTPSMGSMASVAVLGTVSTALGILILFHLIRRAGATFVSLNNYLAPLFGAAFGVGLLHETLTAGILLGFALILGGVGMTSGAMGAFAGVRVSRASRNREGL